MYQIIRDVRHEEQKVFKVSKEPLLEIKRLGLEYCMDNIFDIAKQEIKELVYLAKYIEKFDALLMSTSISPTKDALEKRKRYEKRYVTLLAKYT